MKNNLADLNNHLFAMLEELEDEDIIADPEKFEKTVKKAKMMNAVSTQILNVAKVQVSAIKVMDSCGLDNNGLPQLIAVKDSRENSSKKMLPGGVK